MKILTSVILLFLLGYSQVNANQNESKVQYKKYYQQFGQLSKIWDAADNFLKKEKRFDLESRPPNLKIVMPKCISRLVAKWDKENSKNIVVKCPKDITGKSWDIVVRTEKIGVLNWNIKK